MATAGKRLTPQEYLAIERAAPFKSEYYDGEMYAMSGASWEHTLVKDNVARDAGNQLLTGPCRVLTSDLRVKVQLTGLYTYPDVIVVCEEPQFEDNMFDTLLNPRAVVEVLSDSTEKYDRGFKFEQYRSVPTLQEYIMIAQDRPLVERYLRQDDGTWILTTFKGMSATFAFGSIPVQIAFTAIYRNVNFPEAPGAKPKR